MNSAKVKTRMAPSPTGEYHIGHIRTVLYNWAYARKMKGTFMIRIEDTDRNRFVEGATDRILQVIKDYGLNWDEGPYFQSERLDIYKQYAEELIDKGAAYRCFCTPERLDEMRAEQRAQGRPTTKYDRKCLSLSKEEIEQKVANKESYVVRLKMPDNKVISFDDIALGKIEYNSDDIDDTVLLKSDGFPTYHLAVVVDDHLMEVTHVMRGNDWLPSTPKHIVLYEAFDWEKPVYIHLPNLKELGGTKKLSKRNGPVSAREFLLEGYLPEALLNFVMLLGWKPGSDQEVYSLDEFVDKFELEKISKTDLVAFDRSKLRWMNSEYIKNLSKEDFAKKIADFYNNKYESEIVSKVFELVKERISTLKEFESLADFYFDNNFKIDNTSLSEDDKKHISSAKTALENVDSWALDDINNALMAEVERNGYKTGKFFMSLRLAITGKTVTPPINDSLVILGKDETLRRLSI